MAVSWRTVQYQPGVEAVRAIGAEAWPGQAQAAAGGYQPAQYALPASGQAAGIYQGMRQAQAWLALVQPGTYAAAANDGGGGGNTGGLMTEPSASNALPWQTMGPAGGPDPGQGGGTPPAPGLIGWGITPGGQRYYMPAPGALGNWGQGGGANNKYGPNWNGGNINPPAGSYGGTALSALYQRDVGVYNPDGTRAAPGGHGNWLLRGMGVDTGGGGGGGVEYDYMRDAPRWWMNMVNWRIGQD